MMDKLCSLRRNASAAIQYYRSAIAPMQVLCGVWFTVQWMFGCCIRKITEGHWPGEY